MFKIVCFLLFEWITRSQTCDKLTCVCSSNVCTSCLSSSMWISGGRCLPCPASCALCSSPDNCSSCQPSYFLQGSICQLCGPYCLNCTSYSQCSQCMLGYFLSFSACQPCPIPNSQSCDGTGLVLSCMQGYWQNGNSCSTCREFCLVCSSPSNCLQCQSGYHVAISFGSYCQACSLGCLTCTITGCTQCNYNYQLTGTICIDISLNCSSITNCKSCLVSSGVIVCSICAYPYYLSDGLCVEGSSLLCRSGASGATYQSCLDSCAPYGYVSRIQGNNLVCLVNPWYGGTSRVYINAYDPSFSSMLFSTGVEDIYYNQSSNSGRSGNSILSFTLTLDPYYKTAWQLKLMVVGLSNSSIDLTLTITDNSSNSEQYSSTHTISSSRQPIYLVVQSQKIKDQHVQITILSSIPNSTILPVVGLSECLLQAYPCPSNCRLCYNAQLCITCLDTHFNTPEHLCTSTCLGYLQLYLPSGDPLNFTSKQCVLSCPQTFFPLQLGNIYRCEKCSGLCLTCMSSSQCLSCLSGYLYYQINFECLLSCPISHYQVNVSCIPCSAPCATCLSLSVCLSCSVGYYANGSCISSCPAGTYANTLTATCDGCQPGCSACQGSPSFCLTCASPLLFLDNSCISSCPSTLYYELNRSCLSCQPPCFLCSTKTNCLSCLVGYLHLNACLNACPSGYYPNALSSTCMSCSNGCLTCQSDTLCTSCPLNFSFYNYQCLSSCPSSTYLSGGTCIKCLEPCSTCSSFTFCLTCSIGYLSALSPGSCISACESGYYGYALNSTCLPCNSQCATCSGASSTCSSCASGFLLLGTSCLSQCSSGYFNFSSTCQACSFPCLSCQNTAYSCLTCQPPYILIGSSCLSQCPNFSYLSGTSCFSCLSPCLTCSSSTACLSCAVNASQQTFLSGSQCLTVCPDGFFADNSILTCRQCSYPCLNCLSETVCLSCLNGYLNPSTFVCEVCSGLYWSNTTSQQCQLCSTVLSNCIECLSANECTLCSSNSYLFNQTCLTASQCISQGNYYPDQIQRSCLSCISPCLSCLNASYCTSCLSGLLLQGSCVISCGQGWFGQGGECFSCPSVCLTCSNATSCLTCNTSSFLPLFFSDNATCISINACGTGYYIDSSFGSETCSRCQSPCSTCLNNSFCLGCLNGLLLEGSCKSVCPSGYYPNTLNSTTLCSICDPGCLRCTLSASNCSACPSTLYLKNGSCVSDCGSGYYLDTYIFECFQCVAPCLACSSASSCLSCINSSYLLYQSACLQGCPGGTYESSSNCIPCPSTCLTCSLINSSLLCLQCAPNLFMSMTILGQCVSFCGVSQYGDSATSSCYKCVDPCVSCSNAVDCSTCVSGYLLLGSQCLNITRCPLGYYLLGASCLTSCSSLWAVESSAICSGVCPPPALKLQANNENKCVLSCGDGYRVDSNYTCSQCSSTSCLNLLTVSIQLKSIFNVLYAKISFSQKVNLGTIGSGLTLSIQPISGRRLYSGSVNYSVSTINLDAVWLKLAVNQSVKKSIFIAEFSDYYILGSPLQRLSYSTTVASFDVYSPSQEEAGVKYQRYSEVMSSLMLVLFFGNLLLNSGHLSYLIIDSYQLLFMVLFLAVDYPPHLNHFLFGFRVTHYLFLPQIFRGSPTSDYSSNTPEKFGVIVPDVYFLNNAGPALTIIATASTVLLLVKGLQLIGKKMANCTRSNQVGDQSENHSDGNKDEERQGKCMKLLEGVAARFKWNYFNDVIYSVYFSLMLFAFSQLFELTWRADSLIDNTSIVLAFLVVIAGIVFPIGLAWLLHRQKDCLIEQSLTKQKSQLEQKHKQRHDNQNLVNVNQLSHASDKESQSIRQSVPQYEILTDYKCFVSGVKLQVKLGFYHIPIKYAKKLVLACLLVYCSEYPSLVLGVAMMFCLINLLSGVVLRPYRLTFEQVIYPLFDFISLLVYLVVCVMQLPLLDLTQNEKLNAGYLAISLCVLLSLLLAVHNVVVNVVEVAKFCCGKDYFAGYYQTEYVQKTEEGPKTQEEHSSQGLNKQLEVAEQKQPRQSSASVISGLDLYLRNDQTAPKYLIKCLKPQQQPVGNIQWESEQPAIKIADVLLSRKESESQQGEESSGRRSIGERKAKREGGQKDNEDEGEGQNIFGNIRAIQIEWDD